MKNTDTRYIIKLPPPFLEQKKNEFLAALYERKFQAAEQIYIDIVSHAKALSTFSENDEKLLNQIQGTFKKFKPLLSKNVSSKFKEYNNHLKKLILTYIKNSSANIQHVDFLNWEVKLGLNSHQKELVYKTAMTFQLSSGCSNFCRRCNEWALPKIRSHFSYQAILKIIDHMVELRNDEISLYGASDPLDWKHDNKTIFNVLKKLKKLPIECSILTKVPKGKEPLLKTLIKHKANLSVSVTSQNKSRINKIEQEFDHPIGKQHDLDELLIPAGLDEDFISIKPSITDGYGTEITPDGAFIIIPTFTSALHPFGHKKLPITSKTAFFPVKKTGRKALLVDYFKPLEGYDLNQNRFFLSFLLDVQIESIILDNGTDELTPPGMRSIKEYLSIFEKTAMIQRKKMTLSVLKKLKKQFLARVSFKDLSESKKALYLKKISAHLNLCKKDNCLLAKLHAVSFFLESIFYYKQNHSTKLKMIQFLLKDEIRLSFANPPAITGEKCVEKNLTAPHFDSFDIFRYYVFYLLFKSDDNTILSFIKAYPSIYDSQIDIFIHL